MKDRLSKLVYRSTPSPLVRQAPRFAHSEAIQDCLENLCRIWLDYLDHYSQRSKALFGKPEYPWTFTERAIVSSLAAAIMRTKPDAIVVEELSVKKPGNLGRENAIRPTDRGLCDLWASIPSLTKETDSFNFYLEAKKSLQPKTLEQLRLHLPGKYGISKLFRDVMKGNQKRLTSLSPYQHSQGRIHEHYYVGLLITPLQKDVQVPEMIKDELPQVFERLHRLHARQGPQSADNRKDNRYMSRYPTVALILLDPTRSNPGAIASFTVLGSTKGLSSHNQSKKHAD